jgi:ABC-2 type transport system permease protein
MPSASAVVSRPRASGSVQLWWQRAAALAGVFTNGVFGFIRAYVLLAALEQRPHIGGFDAADAVTFTFLTQGMLAVAFSFGDDLFASRIRTGDVVSDLYRPVDFQGWWLAMDLGRAAYAVVLRFVPQLVICAVAFEVRLPPSPVAWCAFVVSVVFAVVISFGVRYAVALSGFWMLDNRGAWQIMAMTTMFFAGIAVPLTFLPDALVGPVRWLPFAGIAQLPSEIFLGKHDALGMIAILGRQAGWAIVLLALGRAIGARAFHKVVVQGG